MKKYLFMCICFVHLKDKVYAQSLNLDSARFIKMIEQDTNVLKNILDKSLTYIHSNGLRETKSDFIRSISSGKIIYQNFEFIKRERLNTEIRNPIFHGQIKVKGLYEGQPFHVKLAFVSAYVKKHKQFQLIYWQSTKL